MDFFDPNRKNGFSDVLGGRSPIDGTGDRTLLNGIAFGAVRRGPPSNSPPRGVRYTIDRLQVLNYFNSVATLREVRYLRPCGMPQRCRKHGVWRQSPAMGLLRVISWHFFRHGGTFDANACRPSEPTLWHSRMQ